MSLELLTTIAMLCQSKPSIFSNISFKCQQEYIKCVEPKIKAKWEAAEKNNSYAFGADAISLKECILEKK